MNEAIDHLKDAERIASYIEEYWYQWQHYAPDEYHQLIRNMHEHMRIGVRLLEEAT